MRWPEIRHGRLYKYGGMVKKYETKDGITFEKTEHRYLHTKRYLDYRKRKTHQLHRPEMRRIFTPPVREPIPFFR